MSAAHVAFAASLVCLAVSAQLSKDHFSNEKSICDASATVSCSKLNRGAFSTLLGVPVAVWGLIWAFGLVVISAKVLKISINSGNLQIKALWVAAQLQYSIVGLLFVFYLVGVEIYEGVICPLCTVVHVLVVVVTVCAWMLQRSLNYPKGMMMYASLMIWWKERALRFVAVSLGVSALVTLVLFQTALADVPHGVPSGSGFFSSGGRNAVGDGKEGVSSVDHAAEFAQCLSNRGFKVFGSQACSFCVRQKAIVGKRAFEDYIPFVECDPALMSEEDRKKADAPTECQRRGIDAFPTWVQEVPDKEGARPARELRRLEGVQSLQALQAASHCELITEDDV